MNALAHITSGNLTRYDTMVTAIAECARVDEVKDIRDKAVALETYYRQARNVEAEREAANVRLRAERRAGELLKDLARADTPNAIGANQHEVTSDDRTQPQSPFAAALEANGMSRQTAHRYQSLANVPAEQFEDALSGPDKPTTSGIIRRVAPATPQVSDDALWLWGRLRDFENRKYLTCEQFALFASMTEAMRADVLRLAPLVADFLNSLEIPHELA